MAKLDLNLKENAVDSLNEAIAKYQQGQDGDPKAYKFCVLHLAHAVELLLKYYVTKRHPLLIYKNPFAEKIKPDSMTIGLYEALNFLRNEGTEFPAGFLTDLEWLKKLRNQIEHHKFSLEIDEVNEVVGRLVKSIHDFGVANEEDNLAKLIEADQFEVFNELAQTYEHRLKEALEKVEVATKEAYKGYRQKEYGLVDFTVLSCPSCDNETMIPDADADSGYTCQFCGETESDEIEEYCEVCGDGWPKGEMLYIDWAGDGQMVYICPRHSGAYDDD
ncbi:MAG TPA: hypothetical protein VKM35_08315 [Arenimonas sp.]|uniref:hypothetical protein n=1 Tax=Arenimonas sp. TaxID=1872635 RepID=UPI002B82530C|nr:hypothetical protein [Arenimonas sp.]HMB57201.1 hypothetical protein [Arenimonas sp.]